MANSNVRERAVDTLMEINEQGRFLNDALAQEFKRLTPLKGEDRALYTRLVEGTLQEMVYIDYYLEQVSSLRVKKMKPIVRNLLRCSAYQILFLDRVPDYAVVDEAVKIVKKRGMAGLGSFVNGVLRTICDNGRDLELPLASDDPVGFLNVYYSMPRWIVRMWYDSLGYAATEGMLKAFSRQDVPICLWTNELKTTPGELKSTLESAGAHLSGLDDFPGAFHAVGLGDIHELVPYQKGMFYIQNESCAMAVRDALEIAGAYLYTSEKPMRILDVCASPGGKSLYAANLLKDRARIEARDITAHKKERLDRNITRMGYNRLIHTAMRDALVFNKDDVGAYDLVMVDAPCSGLGVVGSKPDLRHRVTPDDIEFLSGTQRDMLSVCSKYVAKGGFLMYSTCTISEAENAENTAWMAQDPEFELLVERSFLPVEENPSIDGFYYAMFRRGG